MNHLFNSNPFASVPWLRGGRFRLGGLVLLGLTVALLLNLVFFKPMALTPTKPIPGAHPVPTPTILVDDTAPPLGRALSERERTLIALTLGLEQPPPPQLTASSQTPLMILHDTAGELSRADLSNRPRYSHSPLGDGIAAYIPRSGEPIITRPALFTPYRPTATAYERGFDILPESRRNPLLRQAWQGASPRTQEMVTRRLLAALQEKPQGLINRMQLWFKASSDRAFDRYLASHPHQIDGGKTTAIWASSNLCTMVLKDPQSTWASSPSAQLALLKTCRQLEPWIQASRTRLATAFNVELVQKEGSDCFVSDAQVQAYNQIAAPAHRIAQGRAVPLQTGDRPAYTESQYEGLVKLYLLGALTAGRFPQIVTHYWLDQGGGRAIGSHCDPRGLNVGEVYRRLSATLHHDPQSLYGPEPQYGQEPAQGDNIWWSEKIMGGQAPSGEY